MYRSVVIRAIFSAIFSDIGLGPGDEAVKVCNADAECSDLTQVRSSDVVKEPRHKGHQRDAELSGAENQRGSFLMDLVTDEGQIVMYVLRHVMLADGSKLGLRGGPHWLAHTSVDNNGIVKCVLVDLVLYLSRQAQEH